MTKDWKNAAVKTVTKATVPNVKMWMNVNWTWPAAALLLTVLILRAHSRANAAADSLAMVSVV